MPWEARIIEALQSTGSKALDYLIYILTYMGDELFFIAVAAVIYWCFSKKFAFRFINVYLLCAGINTMLKSVFKRVRPFNAYENVRSIFKKTHGWSFPSGHSGSIAVIGSQLTLKAHKEKKFFRISLILSAAATLIVMFSRMYLGQHYLTDVITGVCVGVLTVFLFNLLYDKLEEKTCYFWIVTLPLSVIITFIFILTDTAQSNYAVIQSFGAYGAVCLGYYLEKKYIDYDVKNTLFNQIIKVAIGFSVAVIILIGGKNLLEIFIPAGSVAEIIFVWYLLYFLVGLWTMLGANFVFKKLKL